MLGYLLNLFYCLLIAVVSPLLLFKGWKHGKYRDGWNQKLWGQLPTPTSNLGKRVWIHAVSVGEILQLQQIIRELRLKEPSLDLLVTTTTQTGFKVASEKLTDCQVAYFPLDFTWSVREAIRRVQPDLIVLIELELWPNFLREAAARQVPVALINGRLSERSFNGYRKLQPLFSGLLNQITKIAVQSEEYKQRFLKLGVDAERIEVTGSIKFDGVETNRDREEVQSLRAFFELKPADVVFIAGSTQQPEEKTVLETFEKVRQELPNARLIIVPRHPERGDAIARLIEESGYGIIRRSSGIRSTSQYSPVGLLDTVGELGDCWALADVAFVGGSFGDRGGQNMLEPAAYGAAVCFGPNTRNFKHIVELLHAHRAAQTVRNQAELEEFVSEMMAQSDVAKAMGKRAQELVLQQQGATQLSVNLLLDILETSDKKTSYSKAA